MATPTDPVLDVPTAALILPAFNEERGLAATLRAVEAALNGNVQRVQIVVVDDGSTDGTASVAEAAGVTLVRHPSNRGKGAAIRSGVAATDAANVVVMDADATYPPDAIEPMLRLIEGGHDYVSGTRRAGRQHIPLMNRLGNVAIATAIRLLGGSSLADPLTGMYALRRSALSQLAPAANGFAVETEIAIRAAHAGLRTAQLPIAYGRREGVSKLRPLRDGWPILRTILILTLLRRRSRRARSAS
ncbi:MAG TPA: glycosyltransferase family 2 protein [Candidatus Limnocylindria bacterium]